MQGIILPSDCSGEAHVGQVPVLSELFRLSGELLARHEIAGRQGRASTSG